jgi:hypothetical protein
MQRTRHPPEWTFQDARRKRKDLYVIRLIDFTNAAPQLSMN